MQELKIGSGVYESWHQWKRVVHGINCTARLAEELKRGGYSRPYVVTTGSLARQATLLRRVTEALGMPAVGEFSSAQAHTPTPTVLNLVQDLRRTDADILVSFGGSTVIDTAKAAALALALGLRKTDDFDMVREELHASTLSEDAVVGELLPHIALPTTLSGAEFSRTVGITDPASKRKSILRFEGLAPSSIYLDPKLTDATPHRLWVATGIKTMADAIEQLHSPLFHPVVSVLCDQAIGLFFTYLPLSDAEDEEIRTNARISCQLASWMALFGMDNARVSIGIGGAIRHQIASMLGLQHGDTTCALLPHVLRFNAPAVPDGYARLASAMRMGPAADVETRRLQVIDAVTKMLTELGLPSRLGELGIERSHLRNLAELVLAEYNPKGNPRDIRSADEVLALLEQAL